MGAVPCDPILAPFVGDLFDRLDEALLEAWIERSAIIEFDACVPRALAEALAVIELLRHHPELLRNVASPG